MKTLVTIVVFLSCLTGVAQDSFINKTWKSGTPIFETIQSSYEFSLVEKDADFMDQWGYSIVFEDDGTFYTSYSAPCGNDCFTRVSGTYKIIHEKYIEVYVSTIKRSGFCSKKDEAPNKVMGTYLFQHKNDQLKLLHK